MVSYLRTDQVLTLFSTRPVSCIEGEMKFWVVLGFVFIIHGGGTTASCPDGFVTLQNQCFLFNNPDKVSWFEAQWNCKEHKAELANLADRNVHDAVKKYLSTSKFKLIL